MTGFVEKNEEVQGEEGNARCEHMWRPGVRRRVLKEGLGDYRSARKMLLRHSCNRRQAPPWSVPAAILKMLVSPRYVSRPRPSRTGVGAARPGATSAIRWLPWARCK